MQEALASVVAAALGLFTHSRIHRINLGAAGDELLMEIERAVPGSVAALDAICPIRRPLGLDDTKLREDVFAKLRGQSVQVTKVDKVQGQPEQINEAHGGG